MPLRDLIIVACHAPFRETTRGVPDDPTRDDAWVLQSFQKGEPPLYIEHARRGAHLAAQNPEALLMCSGGFTRREAGTHWSEAATYLALAEHYNWWQDGVGDTPTTMKDRATGEDYSRDSFENLLFSICRFQQVTGAFPRHVTMVSWAFKEERFDFHREAIRFPAERYTYYGCGAPLGLAPALAGEHITRQGFAENMYGSAGPIAVKRATRNPLKREHPFRECPGLAPFFRFIEDPANARRHYPDPLPWD